MRHRDETTVIGLKGTLADAACKLLGANGVPYRWIDMERDPLAELLGSSLKFAHTPVVLFPDGRELQAPLIGSSVATWRAELAKMAGLHTQPNEDLYDVVILGAGPAGLTAAIYAASEGLTVLVVERKAPGGQAGTSSRIENYPGFPDGIRGDILSEGMVKQAKRLGAEFVVGVEVDKVGRACEQHVLRLSTGRSISARTIVVATGVKYRKLDVPGIEENLGKTVFYGSAPQDAENYRGKTVTIVGGANSAGQAALHFARYAKRVVVLVRKPELELGMSQYLVERIQANPRIDVRTSHEIDAVTANSSWPLHVRMKGDNPGLRTDGLYLMLGGSPGGQWTDWLKCDGHGYILTGRDVPVEVTRARLPEHPEPEFVPAYLEASEPGVFVAGDTRYGSIKRVSTAVGEGAMAVSLIHDHLREEQ